jgi:hypothetical protein
MSTMREKKGREIFQTGTAFRSFAHFEDSNLGRRDYMEDGSPHLKQTHLSSIAFSKTLPNLPSSVSLTVTGAAKLVVSSEKACHKSFGGNLDNSRQFLQNEKKRTSPILRSF